MFYLRIFGQSEEEKNRRKTTQNKKIHKLYKKEIKMCIFLIVYYFQDLRKVYARPEVKHRVYFMWPNYVFTPILSHFMGLMSGWFGICTDILETVA